MSTAVSTSYRPFAPGYQAIPNLAVGRMATAIDKVEEFLPEWEDWTPYIERLEQFSLCNDIKEEPMKQLAFLSVLSPSAYKLLSRNMTHR